MGTGHFLTGFVLSAQLCSFLVLRLSFEGTQQARPFPWLPLCILRCCQAEEPVEPGALPAFPVCPHFQVSSGRAGWFASGG